MSSKGFSLIELMVVVAVVSVLAAVGIPPYSSFTFKARQVEARVSLSGIYTAQKAFHFQFGAYHSSFQAVGFEPVGNVHYNIGFGSAGTVAGPAHGFNLVVDATLINSRAFCGGIGGANVPGNRCTFIHPTPVLNAALTVGEQAFYVGAVNDKSPYGAQIDPTHLPHQMLLNSPVVRIALGSLFFGVHAQANNSVDEAPIVYNMAPRHEMWVLDHRKRFSKHAGDE